MHSSSPSFPLVLSILLLTTVVCTHPQLPLPSSGEPPTAFPLDNSGITSREDTPTTFPFEDAGFGDPQSLKVVPLSWGPNGIEQFLSSTSSGSTNYRDGGEMSINHPGPLPSADESSTKSGNEISQNNACDQRPNNTLKSRRRLRNRDSGQEIPSWCSTNPNDRNSPSKTQTTPGQQPAGTGDRKLDDGGKIPVDVPTLDSPNEESDYTGTSTKTRANLEMCPPDRIYPVCADDEAISASSAALNVFFAYTTYMLNPAYACRSALPIPSLHLL
ncbi:hypothetical protein MMC31_005220 [Peltigera leucophlebia]|nr:hypothetical protein [Peltigera leucophlebia]